MIRRWTVATILSVAVTLALMGVMAGFVMPKDPAGDMTMWEDDFFFEVKMYRPPIQTWHYPCRDCAWRRIEPPSLPSLDLDGGTISMVAFPIPTAGLFVRDTELFGSVDERNCQSTTGELLHPANVPPLVPTVRVLPEYPTRSNDRGVEGYVVVQFDIAPDGTVQDARVIESNPPHFFDRSALRAIAQFRYDLPVDVNGDTMTICDQTMRINFIVED